MTSALGNGTGLTCHTTQRSALGYASVFNMPQPRVHLVNC